MVKTFEVEDRSGRDFGKTTMNQNEVFDFVDADNYDREQISNLLIGQKYNEISGTLIERVN